MIIQKSRLGLAEIEVFVDCLGKSIVDELKNGVQFSAMHMGQLFKFNLKSCC